MGGGGGGGGVPAHAGYRQAGLEDPNPQERENVAEEVTVHVRWEGEIEREQIVIVGIDGSVVETVG